jgi:hypothetical protein
MTDTTAPRTAAGRRLLDLYFGAEDDLAGGGIEHLVLTIEAEAIEPLLALVRAVQDVTARERDREWFAVTRLRDALAALPESVRVAARKPE